MATENAKFFYFLSKELTSDGFKFMHVSPKKFDRKLHSRDEIIITTGSEGPNLPELPDDVVILSYDDTQYPLSEKNVQNFYRMFRILMDSGIEECNRIDIGVDPGFKHTGLALFVNNTFVEATIIPTSDARIKDFLEMAIATSLHNCGGTSIPPVRIKIGDGNAVEMKKVVDLVLKMHDNFPMDIKIVNESHSNTDFIINNSNFIKISDHAKAAINIALRDGLSLEQLKQQGEFPKNPDTFSKKQLRNIQAESRASSGEERITIDQRLATKVLLGQLSLQDAIGLYKDSKSKLNNEANRGTS